jgi:hypothetical protein
LKNKLIKLKKQEDRTLWLSHGTCSYIRMYINAVADSVMLCLQHDFCNIIFKIKHKLYIDSGSALPPPPQRKNSGCTAEWNTAFNPSISKTVYWPNCSLATTGVK